MNADLKARWVAALRSGEYKRGSSTLKRALMAGDTFTGLYEHCCLGVLCEVAGVSLVLAPYDGGDLRATHLVKGTNQHGYIDGGARALVDGLSTEHQLKLASINDKCIEDDYEKVIKYIEKEL